MLAAGSDEDTRSTDERGGEVGEGLGDGHFCAGGGGEEREGGAFAHCHCFAGVDVEAVARAGDSHIRNGNLRVVSNLYPRRVL